MRSARLIAVVLAVLATRAAYAEDEIVRGAVVKVEAAEIYVNLGKDRAVSDGAPLRIKRSIKLVHPVTRQPFEDWIPIGSAVVTQAGGQLSRAVVGALIDEIKLGDVAEVYIDRPDAPAPPVGAPPPGPAPGPAIDPVTTAVLTAFAQQTGQGLDARIATWEGFLSKYPASAYAPAIRRDVDDLIALREQMRPRTGPDAGTLALTLGHTAPTRVRAGAAIPLVFFLDQPQQVAAAYLHYRITGARTYHRMLLEREHDNYLRGVIPGLANARGVDYFLEVATPAGPTGLALATPAAPIHVEVEAASVLRDRFAPAPGRSRVRATGEYLDFATFDPRSGTRTDTVVNANVDFTYRIDRVIQSIGVGYGVLVGRGGFADREYSSTDPVPRSAFQFGYADLELAISETGVRVSAGGRLIAGVGREGFGLGIEGRARFGNRDAANLQLIASTLEQIGFVTDIKFGARPAPDLGFAVSVGATDQPNNGDVAVKLGTELEYFASRTVSILLRGSWQGRTTQHGGLGGGAGVGFTW